METLIRQYTALKQAFLSDKDLNIDLPELTPCLLSITTTPTAEAKQTALNQRIKDFQPLQGWLCYQSAVISFSDGDLSCLDEATNGRILNGELVNADRKSLHIHPDGNGHWLVTEYVEQVGHELLRQLVSYLGTDKSPGKLNYAVYWEHDTELGYQRKYSRFMGFSPQEKA